MTICIITFTKNIAFTRRKKKEQTQKQKTKKNQEDVFAG